MQCGHHFLAGNRFDVAAFSPKRFTGGRIRSTWKRFLGKRFHVGPISMWNRIRNRVFLLTWKRFFGSEVIGKTFPRWRSRGPAARPPTPRGPDVETFKKLTDVETLARARKTFPRRAYFCTGHNARIRNVSTSP